ncbi:MAG: S41 family peptidase [Defluviitaleaceae bacterium]|nr:S41 family peptidase [Defluviitaleaceae bacterium]
MEKYKAILGITVAISLLSAVLIFLPAIFMPQGSDCDFEVTNNANVIEPTQPALTRERHQWRPPELTREQFLEDFDFLITTLEENFPSFGVIYRRNGVDMLALAPELRERILDESIEWDYAPFFNMLRQDFFRHAFPVGHLYLKSHQYFPPGPMNQRNVYAYFGGRLGNAMWHTDHHVLHISNMYKGFSESQIVANIMQEGRVAYIRLPSSVMLDNAMPTPSNIRRVDDFYSQLEGAEHLIIDMRGILGGWPTALTRLLIAPLIDYPLETTFHQFIMAGDRNTRFMISMPRAIGERVPFYMDDLSYIFPHGGLTEAVAEDLRYMDYHIARTISVAPHPERRAPFNGKVWLLTDMNNFSAAQQVASFLHQTGFATLVGQTTGGAAADALTSSFNFTLPNTGFMVRYDPLYIISADGRPWEYGTVPHHFNRDGMNALQTVLALIAEGNY